MPEERKTAGIVIIGDEILSGRTKDTNFNTIAVFLGEIGIEVCEGRTVADQEAAIIEAVNALRARYDYVFTTGGIGPTHDDITADSVAKAFGVPLEFNAEAMALLGRHYSPDRFNDARKRMARAPVGASLVDNPISIAPGFMIENVIVMAGIPAVVEGMLQSVRARLVGGPKLISSVVVILAAEGDVAGPLADIQAHHPGVAIGSYPSFTEGRPRVRVVLRSTDEAALAAATKDVEAMTGAS